MPNTCRGLAGRPSSGDPGQVMTGDSTPAKRFAALASGKWTCWPAKHHPKDPQPRIRLLGMASALVQTNLLMTAKGNEVPAVGIRRPRISTQAVSASESAPPPSSTWPIAMREQAPPNPLEFPTGDQTYAAYLGKRCVGPSQRTLPARGQAQWLPDPDQTCSSCE